MFADGPVVLGIRPESFEDAALAPTLPAIDVSVQVLEDLGSDAHVFFLADARPVTPEALETADDARVLIAGAGTLLTARVHASTAIRAGRASLARRRHPRSPLLRSGDGPAPRAGRDPLEPVLAQ